MLSVWKACDGCMRSLVNITRDAITYQFHWMAEPIGTAELVGDT